MATSIPPSMEPAIPLSGITEPDISQRHSSRNLCDEALDENQTKADRDNQHGGEATSVVTSAAIDDSFPEGGLEAWLVVLGSFFGTAVTLGMM
jgi:hypothetical protein